MADYGLVEPFDVDDGSLAGASAEECFALGVEWMMFRDKLRRGVPFTDLVLANNAARLVRMAERHGRFVEHRPPVAGWVSITVGSQSVCAA